MPIIPASLSSDGGGGKTLNYISSLGSVWIVRDPILTHPSHYTVQFSLWGGAAAEMLPQMQILGPVPLILLIQTRRGLVWTNIPGRLTYTCPPTTLSDSCPAWAKVKAKGGVSVLLMPEAGLGGWFE